MNQVVRFGETEGAADARHDTDQTDPGVESARKSPPRGIIPRLHSQLPDLTESLRRVAEVIIENPQGIVSMRASQVARLAEVGEAAVVRLAQRLGFDGFRDLQVTLAYELGAGQRQGVYRTENITENIEVGDNLRKIAEKSYLANLQALQEAWELLDFEAFEKAVDLIAQSRQVLIYAQGANRSTGEDLSYNLSKLGFICQVHSDPYMQLVTASLVKRDDVVVAISHTGANRDILEAVSVARQKCPKTIGITVRAGSPLTRLVEVALCTARKEIVFYDEPLTSRITLMYLVDILFMGVAWRTRHRSTKNLRSVQEALRSRRHPK